MLNDKCATCAFSSLCSFCVERCPSPPQLTHNYKLVLTHRKTRTSVTMCLSTVDQARWSPEGPLFFLLPMFSWLILLTQLLAKNGATKCSKCAASNRIRWGRQWRRTIIEITKSEIWNHKPVIDDVGISRLHVIIFEKQCTSETWFPKMEGFDSWVETSWVDMSPVETSSVETRDY